MVRKQPLTSTVYIACIVNPRKTTYVRGEVLYHTASDKPDTARERAMQYFARFPREATPEIEVVAFFDSVPTSSGSTAALSRSLYTVREAAALMGVAVTTLNRWIASGEMPYVQVGYNQVKRIACQDIEAWIERNRKVA